MPYFVTMTDKFLSGWGAASGKINKMIVECDTYDQAAQIARAARLRSEMRRVNIRQTRPYYGAQILATWKAFDDLHGSWKEA